MAGSGSGAGAFVRVVSPTADQTMEFFQAFAHGFLGGDFVAGA